MTFQLQKYLLQKLYVSISFILFFILLSAGTAYTQCGSGKPLVKGPKGGCYYLTKSGNKQYVDRSCCTSISTSGSNNISPSQNNSGCGNYKGNALSKGSKGGCYYINRNGNKTYVERHLCNC